MKKDDCLLCNIEHNKFAPIVFKDELTIAYVSERQFHPGHTIVCPIEHYQDVREIDFKTGSAIMRTLSKMTKVVSKCFPNNGISIWSSIGPAAFQEVPHLHLHIHPRLDNDNFLRVYPEGGFPGTSPPEILEERAKILINHLKESSDFKFSNF